MKPTNRQKKIVLTFASLFFLIVLISGFTAYLVKRNKSQSSYFESNSSELNQEKSRVIKEIEQKLISDNIKESDLLQKLKESHHLTSEEND
jgi:outer membrane protein OmpA-like peptidoglycan-associated protein